MQIVYNGLPKFLGRLLYAYLHPLLGADELNGSHGSLSLPFVMKVMVCHFVSDSHEVMTDCTHCRVTYNCCGDFSATSSSFPFLSLLIVAATVVSTAALASSLASACLHS
jgi:hypothetical protein